MDFLRIYRFYLNFVELLVNDNMADGLGARLDRLAAKAQLFADKYNRLAAAKRESDRRVDELLRQLEHQSIEIADLRRRLAYQEVAGAVAPTREAVEQSRSVIAELVREIDKCIADLTS